jgi:release factor glutamine methyltransferase
LDFVTTKETLIPRPETELLVARCLELTKDIKSPRILEIGTGSGNIAVSLTKMDETCTIVALDASREALDVAGLNAVRHGVENRIEFFKNDIFTDPFPEAFDIIVSNPPYIPTWEIATLAGHVKEEPIGALDGGEDGLDFYKKIISDAPGLLKEHGSLVMEMGYGQSYKIKKLLEAGGFTDIKIYKDTLNIDRVIKALWIN